MRSDAAKPGSFVAVAGGCGCPKTAPLVFGVTRLYAVDPACPLHGVDVPWTGTAKPVRLPHGVYVERT